MNIKDAEKVGHIEGLINEMEAQGWEYPILERIKELVGIGVIIDYLEDQDYMVFPNVKEAERFVRECE